MKTTIKFVRQEDGNGNRRWYPVSGDTIDMRGRGYGSKKEAKEAVRDYAGKVAVKFV